MNDRFDPPSGGGLETVSLAIEGGVALQQTGDWTLDALVQLLGLSLFAVVATMGLAFAYRAVTARPLVPGGAIVVGTALVGSRLVLAALRDGAVVDPTPLDHHASGAYLLGVLAASAVGAEVGRRTGDHVASDVFDVTTLDAATDVAEPVRASRLVTTVTFPDRVADLDGFPVVDEAVKRALADTTVVVPLRCTGDELERRLADRIERDYPVAYAHIVLGEGDEVEYLAVGGPRTGIGPTLPPETVATAIEADPAPGASPGEPVEIWSADRGEPALISTGVFRASVGDVATVVVDDADAVDGTGPYRLVTRPDARDDVGAFAARLRRVDETIAAITIDEDGPLEGEFTDWLPAPVLVIDREGRAIPFPEDNETLVAGDVVYVLGSPATLHGLAAYERTRDRAVDGEESSTRPTPRPVSDGGEVPEVAGIDR